MSRKNLSPKTAPEQRKVIIGDVEIPTNQNIVSIITSPDDHRNLATLRSMLEQFKSSNCISFDLNKEIQKEIKKVESLVETTLADNQSLTSAVRMATVRRVSRESVYTAILIDQAAKSINKILSMVAKNKTVYVPKLDRIDRPSLKIIVRAALVQKRSQNFGWIFQLDSYPKVMPEDLYCYSRSKFLGQTLSVIQPTIEVKGSINMLNKPVVLPANVTSENVVQALVMQNYDAVFLWAYYLLSKSNDVADIFMLTRSMALAAVNIEQRDLALKILNFVEYTLPLKTNQVANLCYLQGLIASKRSYDLIESENHYQRGCKIIASKPCNTQDLDLEKSWLENGSALNLVLRWRNDSDEKNYVQALNNIKKALSRVSEGKTPSRAYLRSNLVANLVFLLEMGTNPANALTIFQDFFRSQMDEPNQEPTATATIKYRIAFLNYASGNLSEALKLLADAVEKTPNDYWFLRERLLRAQGVIALQMQQLQLAETCFREGLDLCLENRAAEGALEHGKGLIKSLLCAEKLKEAETVYTLLMEEEVCLLHSQDELKFIAPSLPSNKLPAYIPEVDLESVPKVNLNQFLINREGFDEGLKL